MKKLAKIFLLSAVLFSTATTDAMAGSRYAMASSNDDSAYAAFRVGLVGSAEDLEIKELQSSDFIAEGQSSAVSAANFNTLYGSTTGESTTGRKFKYGLGFTGSFAYGFNVGGNLRMDVEIYGTFQKPDSDNANSVKSDYLAVNLDGGTGATYFTNTGGSAQHGSLRADGTGSFSRIGGMINVQACASCLMESSKVGLYIGAGAGGTYYSLYKASKIGVAYQIRADVEYPLSDDVMFVATGKYGGLYSPTLKSVAFKGFDGTDGGTNAQNTSSDEKATGAIKFTEATFDGLLGVRMVL